MPTLIIENMPESLFARIQHLAKTRQQNPADAVVEVLEAALARSIPTGAEQGLPQEPFLAEEICAPCSIPRPIGQRIIPVEIVDHFPKPHDAPYAE